MAVAPHILAIDLGTSGPKVALVSAEGTPLDCTFSPTTLQLFPGGGAEQDPADWWRAIVAATRELVGKHPAEAAQVIAVAVTAQWSGTVPVDRAGKPLCNAHIWMDSRGAPEIAELTGGAISIEGYGVYRLQHWVRVTGGIPGRSGKDSIAHVLHLRAHQHAIYEKTYKFLEPLDYLNLRLTGQFAASTASVTLLWLTDNRDLARVRYDDRLLRWAGIDRDKLPDLKASTDVLGPVLPDIAAELGIPPAAQVILGAPDMHAATLGAGAAPDYVAQLYIGTSSILTCHVPFKKADLLHSMGSIPSALPDRYLAASTQETAGVCLSHLFDQHFYADDELATGPRPADAYDRLDRAVARIPAGSDKLLFTPWLYGERMPVDDASLRGCLFNWSLKTTRSHVARAVMEGVAYNARWMLDPFQKMIGQDLNSLVMIGGGARSDRWCQIHADVLGIPVRQAAQPLWSNALGVAFLASLALGHLKREDLPGRVPIAQTLEPDPKNRAVYDELFEAFVEIYRRNKKLFGRLNRR